MSEETVRTEPRWPGILALVAVAGLRFALPDSLAVGPKWLLMVVVVALLIPYIIGISRGIHRLGVVMGYVASSVVTLDMVWSLGLLVRALPEKKLSPQELLQSASALWVANILVFATWYWRLDAGGPRAREVRGTHTDGAFLFPQMTLDAEAKKTMGEENWSPEFMDYLFLAFNTNTAFSPTDVPVLSRWAKGLMMLQALISFATVALLAARAVNIL